MKPGTLFELLRRFNRRANSSTKGIAAILFMLGAYTICSTSPAQGQTINPASRPILFVHGYCGDSDSWATLRSSLASKLYADLPALYPNPNAIQDYDVYYDAGANFVAFSQNGNQVLESSIPSNARIFSIKFYDPNGGGLNSTNVAQVSILNKANELAQVIHEITQITHVKDVIVVGHSMGGLVTRAYLEGLASSLSCYDYNNGEGGTPSYRNGLCTPGQTPYAGDVATLVTIDTPHGGADLAILDDGLFGELFPMCLAGPSTTKTEMLPGSELLQNLNYNEQTIGRAQTISSLVNIQSIESYFTDGNYWWQLIIGGENDTIVAFNDQSMQLSLNTHYKNGAQFGDWGNPYTVESIDTQNACALDSVTGILHLIQCVGAQTNTQGLVDLLVEPVAPGTLTSINVKATLDGNPWTGPVNYTVASIDDPQCTSNSDCRTQSVIPPPASFTSDWAPGFYEMTNVSGGPSTNAGTLPVAFLGQDPVDWDITLTINFYSTPPPLPLATTQAAAPVYTNDAILNGTVNPEGSATNAWFEWGTDSTMSVFQSTIQQSVSAGNTSVPITFDQAGLSSNTTYYYRIAASNGGGTNRGLPVSFVPLNTLPAPTLASPANASNGISLTPTFSWSPVTSAQSYRLLVATNPADLPTDPSSSTCGVGCILSASPAQATYVPGIGILSAGATYYWEASATGSGLNGNWSSIYSFTTSSVAPNDFALQVSPTSQSLSQSGSVGYNVTATTISGLAQSITFSATNLPPGVTAMFTPSTITSGNSSNLTLSAGSSASLGAYTVTILATGSTSSHSAQASVTVTSASAGPIITLTPTSQIFPDQTVGTVGTSQTLMFMNTGSGQVTINSVSLAAGSDFIITQQPTLPLILNSLVPATLQVAFAPSAVGPRSGQILFWDTAPTSPQVASLSGNGLVASPTNGTIQVNGTLNGTPMSAGYPFSFTLSGPATYTGGGAYTFTATPGSYTLSFNGTPSDLTLASITPSASQTVAAGGVVTYTMNFTAPNDFYGPFFGVPQGQGWSAQFGLPGSTATYSISDPNPPNGNASVPLTLQVLGNPSSDANTFNPQPMYSGTGGTLTIATNSSDPVGAYTLSLNATNTSGLAHSGTNTSTLIITSPPSHPTQLASETSTGVQGNAASSIAPGAVSADGRYVVFNSSATNLGANASSGVFLRDTQAGSTSLVSVSSNGTPADDPSGYGSISANGRYVVFYSMADNLVAGAILGNQSIYVRDLQQGTTEREDVTSSGTGGNAGASQPVISADGRFVAFASTSTNLTSGATSGTNQIYLRDRNTGQIRLVTVGIDGNPANQGGNSPAISADGRYVAYYSTSTNLVSQSTSGLAEVYVYDTQLAQTILASAAADGTPAGQLVLTNYSPPAMSADGRFVSFISNATNLIPGVIDFNGDFRVFLKDLKLQSIVLVDTDANAVRLAMGGTEPQISADGRFVAYMLYGQVFVRDMDSNQSIAVSLAPSGAPGNNLSFGTDAPNINPSATVLAYESTATNLIASDTNNASDVFVSPNPLLSSPYVQSLTLAPLPASGGSTITGTITLSAPAPSNGATVAISGNNPLAEVPSSVLVPSGATSATFSFATSVVASETVMTVIGSYNGASAVELLTLEPAATLVVNPLSLSFGDQLVGSSSTAQTLALSNSGTAPLGLNSITFVSGQAFQTSANTCGATIAVGSSCTVSIVFDPTVSGPFSDSVQINYGNPSVVQPVLLSGTGSTALASLTPTTLNFGSQSIPSSTPGTISLTNTGGEPLSSIVVTVTGQNTADFTISSDACSGNTLQPNSTCLINLSFSPQASGARNASLTVTDNAPGSPQSVALTGTGTAAVVTLSPTSLAFGNQSVGTSSGLKTATLTNSGNASLSISSVAITGTNVGDFSQTNNCGTSLAAGVSCTISVTFKPTATGTRTATVSVTDNATASPQKASLTGKGTAAPAVTLSPTSLAFGNQAVGTSSAVKSATLTNSGNASLSITSVAITGTNVADFSQTDNCGTSLAAGTSCTISVTFKPTATGSRTAFVSTTDNATGSPQKLSLAGTGTAAPAVTLSPTSLAFGNQAVGTSSAMKSATLTNSGNAALSISSVAITGTNLADFSQTNNCGTSLAAAASCTISVTFKPTATGARAASVSITDNAGGSPQKVSLAGTGTAAPAVTLSPTSLSFGNQKVGTASAVKTVTLTNSGAASLTISAIKITGTNSGDFSETNNCGSSVAAGSSCTLSVRFKPTTTGSRVASVSVTDNAAGSPQNVSLAGTGT
jgi:pimeloyl-ACP methyl ester carboxylesterase